MPNINNGEITETPQPTPTETTTPIDLSKRDFLNDVWFDAWLADESKKREILAAETLATILPPAPTPLSTKPTQTAMPTPTHDPMETTQARIKFLENAVAPLKKKFLNASDFDYNKFEELNTLAGELSGLKIQAERERVMFDRFCKKYDGTFATKVDIKRLWLTRGRDEAIQGEIDVDKTLKELKKTDLYKVW